MSLYLQLVDEVSCETHSVQGNRLPWSFQDRAIDLQLSGSRYKLCNRTSLSPFASVHITHVNHVTGVQGKAIDVKFNAISRSELVPSFWLWDCDTASKALRSIIILSCRRCKNYRWCLGLWEQRSGFAWLYSMTLLRSTTRCQSLATRHLYRR